MHWAVHAACRGMDTALFYSWGTTSRRGRPASRRGDRYVDPRLKQACARCPVRVECLEHALEHWEHGWWGGTSEDDRREMRPLGVRARRLESGMAEWEFPGKRHEQRLAQRRWREERDG